MPLQRPGKLAMEGINIKGKKKQYATMALDIMLMK